MCPRPAEPDKNASTIINENANSTPLTKKRKMYQTPETVRIEKDEPQRIDVSKIEESYRDDDVPDNSVPLILEDSVREVTNEKPPSTP